MTQTQKSPSVYKVQPRSAAKAQRELHPRSLAQLVFRNSFPGPNPKCSWAEARLVNVLLNTGFNTQLPQADLLSPTNNKNFPNSVTHHHQNTSTFRPTPLQWGWNTPVSVTLLNTCWNNSWLTLIRDADQQSGVDDGRLQFCAYWLFKTSGSCSRWF